MDSLATAAEDGGVLWGTMALDMYLLVSVTETSHKDVN